MIHCLLRRQCKAMSTIVFLLVMWPSLKAPEHDNFMWKFFRYISFCWTCMMTWNRFGPMFLWGPWMWWAEIFSATLCVVCLWMWRDESFVVFFWSFGAKILSIYFVNRLEPFEVMQKGDDFVLVINIYCWSMDKCACMCLWNVCWSITLLIFHDMWILWYEKIIAELLNCINNVCSIV